MTTGLRNMMWKSLCQKVIGAVLGIFGLFRRVICRVTRRRKDSGTILPVTANHLAPTVTQSVPSNDVELESWESWGAEDQPMGYGGSRPNQQQNRYNKMATAEVEPEPDVDYFTGMQPALKRAAKIKLKKKEDLVSNGFSSRLAANTVPVTQDGELGLGAWENTENAWEGENEDLSWEADAVIKERRRLEREKRHMDQMRKKQERENRLGRKDIQLPAVRLS